MEIIQAPVVRKVKVDNAIKLDNVIYLSNNQGQTFIEYCPSTIKLTACSPTVVPKSSFFF